MATEAGPASESRIKRQVSSRQHLFATICPPGFEKESLAEARALGLCVAPESAPASVFEWTGRLPDLYRANLFLRVASRILVRLDDFRAGAREELFRKVLAFPWELWLSPGRAIRVEAHLEHARISHEGLAATTVTEAIQRRMREAGCELSPTTGQELEQRIILHLEDNHARISLDSSGEHLHRRGWRTRHGAAPLRENLAAGLLQWCGWPGRFTCLVDGMSASGTFAIEARSIASGRTAASAQRDFPFRQWPSFASETFMWLQRQIVGGNFRVPQRIIANDIDAEMILCARENERGYFGDTAIEWHTQDFFLLEVPAVESGCQGLLCLNPPYGIRLADENGNLYSRIMRDIEKRWQGWHVLLLGPPDSMGPVHSQRAFKKKSFRHGGLRIAALFMEP